MKSLPFIFKNFNNNNKILRERSKSENNPIINHPYTYVGIGKISRGTQTALDLGSPSLWSPKFKLACKCDNEQKDGNFTGYAKSYDIFMPKQRILIKFENPVKNPGNL